MQIEIQTQAVTPEIREWILAQAAAGCVVEDMHKSMLASGWDAAVARAALEHTLQPPTMGQPALPTATPVPGPDLAGAPSLLQLPDREVQLLFTLRQPRAMLFGSFLSDDECDALMAWSLPRLARSETVQNATGGSEVNAARTSDGMFFERGEAPLIERIEQRIAALLHWPVGPWRRPAGAALPAGRAVPAALRLLRPGAAGHRSGAAARRAACGHAADVPEHTAARRRHHLPRFDLEVAPIKGHARLLQLRPAACLDRTLHGGAPVTAGEKWVATKWLREGVFS